MVTKLVAQQRLVFSQKNFDFNTQFKNSRKTKPQKDNGLWCDKGEQNALIPFDYKAFKKAMIKSTCRDEIHTFRYFLHNSFQEFRNGFTCQGMTIKGRVGKNNVRCTFFHQRVKPDLAPSIERGTVCTQGAYKIPYETIL